MSRSVVIVGLILSSCRPAPSAEPVVVAASTDTAEVAGPDSTDGASPGSVEPSVAEPRPAADDAPLTPDAASDERGEGGSSEADEPANSASAPEKSAVADLPNPLFKSIKGSCGRDPGVGTKLKSFRLPNLEGQDVTNGRYRNRVMLVNFWGTWCKPCLKELPEFDRLYRRYRKHGMTLVAIATDEDPAPVKALVAKRKLKAKVLLGGERYASQYGAPSFPFSYVVDTSGTILGSYHGFKEECMGKLEDDIRKALRRRNGR